MTAPTRLSQPLRGVLYFLAGMMLLSVMDAFAKFLGQQFAVGQVLFLRTAFAFPVIVIFVLRAGGFAMLKTRFPLFHIFRALLATGAAGMFFWGFKYLELADAFAIAFASPLFLTALSIPVLGEKVGPHRWGAVMIGFIGVLIIIRPGLGAFSWAAVLPLASSLCYALLGLTTRLYSGRGESTISMVFWTALGTLIASGFSAIPDWQTPGFEALALFAVMGVIGALGQLALAEGFRFAEASLLAAFEYSAMIWGVLFGWLIWSDFPDLWVWVGSGVLFAAGFYITRRESRAQVTVPIAEDSPLPLDRPNPPPSDKR